jgi:hypothetical protein
LHRTVKGVEEADDRWVCDKIHNPLAIAPIIDDSCFTKHAEMLGYVGL